MVAQARASVHLEEKQALERIPSYARRAARTDRPRKVQPPVRAVSEDILTARTGLHRSARGVFKYVRMFTSKMRCTLAA